MTKLAPLPRCGNDKDERFDTDCNSPARDGDNCCGSIIDMLETLNTQESTERSSVSSYLLTPDNCDIFLFMIRNAWSTFTAVITFATLLRACIACVLSIEHLCQPRRPHCEQPPDADGARSTGDVEREGEALVFDRSFLKLPRMTR